MKAVCIDNPDDAFYLTIGKEYVVGASGGDSFIVKNDAGFESMYDKKLFEILYKSSKAGNIEGGPSSYYDLKIKRRDGTIVECTVQDIISSVLLDNWHFGNIFKAMVRIIGKRNGGGKANTEEKYDTNKIAWFVEDFQSRANL